MSQVAESWHQLSAPQTADDGTAKTFVDLPHSDHNDVLEADGEVLQEAVTRFVQKVERRQPADQ